MRYVGRHRAPRPLLLRRPVVGGVAAAAILAVPVLYATGNFDGAIQGGTPSQQIADGTKLTPTPAGAETGTPDADGTVIPTDDSAIPTTSPTGTPSVATTTTRSGRGSGSGSGSGNQTTRPATTTTKPAKTTTKPPKTTTKPPVTTTKPVVTTTKPPATTVPPTTTVPPVEPAP